MEFPLLNSLRVALLLGATLCGMMFPVELCAADEQRPWPRRSVVAETPEGRPVHCDVYGEGADILLVIATIHGNESAGTPLVEALGKWLLANPQELTEHKVVIMPVANPDGMAHNVRYNSNGIDLNRNFPAGNWSGGEIALHGPTPLSEIESRAIMRVLCTHFPNRVISIHQPLECVDYDGPAEELAQAMAAECPLEVKKLGSLPGSLGSFVGVTLEKPIITLELPKDASHDADQLWEAYGGALRAALHFHSDRTAP